MKRHAFILLFFLTGAVAQAAVCSELFQETPSSYLVQQAELYFSEIPRTLDPAAAVRNLLANPKSVWSKTLGLESGVVSVSHSRRVSLINELYFECRKTPFLKKLQSRLGLVRSDRVMETILEKKLLAEGVDAYLESLGILPGPLGFSGGLSAMIRDSVNDPVNASVDKATALAFINFASVLTANRFNRDLGLEFKPLTPQERQEIRVHGFSKFAASLRKKWGNIVNFSRALNVFEKTVTVVYFKVALSLSIASFQGSNISGNLAEIMKVPEDVYQEYQQQTFNRDAAIRLLLEGRIEGWKYTHPDQTPDKRWIENIQADLNHLSDQQLQGG